MLTQDLPIFIGLSILSEILGTVGGFGSSVFFVPMANYFMDFQTVLGLTALFHLSSNISKIGFFRKGFDKKLVLTLGIPAVVFVSIGAFLSKFLNPTFLTLALAAFLIIFSLVFIIMKELKIMPTTKNAIIGGTFSGLIAGLLGTGGAIRGATMSAFDLKKDQFIATSAIIDLGIDLSRSIIYSYNGFVKKEVFYLIPILFIIGIIGTYIGKRILDRITQEQFKRFVLFLILAIGVSTLVMNYR
ncbi:MAG: sulfite exporter TauE/SafE family protein [Croceitalea sp.]|nr:sulfite exporter TauE/SafE family protein [Croceitalea sp.]NNC33381.1 sulfite exporter TauE/SafE family protein [Croceitalea sp.]